MSEYNREEKLKLELLDTAEESSHFHPDVEIIYVLEGQMDVHVEGRVTNLMAGDLLLINSGVSHSYANASHLLCARLSILLRLFSDVIDMQDVYFLCDPTKAASNEYKHMVYLIRKLLREYANNNQSSYDFAFIACCYEIMDALMRDFTVSRANQKQSSDSEKFEDRIARINNYIYANYNKQIGIKELSEQMYLSVGYLSRFFKKNYNMNFTDYLTQIRLNYAVDELLNTDNIITKVAFDNGFSSVSAFNNLFKKKFGTTPSVYRKDYSRKNTDPMSLNASVLHLEEILGQDDSAHKMAHKDYTFKIPSNIHECPPTNNCWNQTINIGAANDLLSSEMQEHVVILKSSFSFEYARFWSPFTRDMLIDVNDQQGNYNFSRIDSVLDFLVKQNLKPHIELNFKPYRIQRQAGVPIIFHEEEVMYTPQNWERLLNAFIGHIVERYSTDTVRKWRFELWRPESEMRGEDNTLNYLDFFARTWRIIKKYDSEIQIGGSGQHIFAPGDVNYNFLKSFLKSFAQAEVRPDFLSFSSYPYILSDTKDGETNYSERYDDVDFMLHGLENIDSMLSGSALENVSRQITEWSGSVSDRNFINDTTFKGAFIIKQYIDSYGKSDVIAYFSGSDCSSESFDSSALLHGGNGLIAKYGILKPAGFAIDFLNRSYPYYIAKNDHCLVTSDGSDNYGIVCHNCKKLNSTFFLTDEDRIDKENISQYFEDNNPVSLHFSLDGIKNGWYQIKIYRINDENGSILNLWHEVEYEQNLSQHDISYFRRMCEPNLTIRKVHADKHLLDLSIEMLANEISFIKISLKSE